MGPDEYADALERDGRALADAAEGVLQAPVPSCPGWTVADLVYHTGEVHDEWGQVVDRRLQDHSDVSVAERVADDQLVGWFRHGVERLAGTLRSADPTVGVWTWAARKDVGFVQRRMAQETAVHRWDAEAARGAAGPIEAALAADGIDEFLEMFLPADPERLSPGAETVHLHATDGTGEWTISVRDGALEVARSHAKGDAAVRAPASDLLLMLWRRLPHTDLERFGDERALTGFLGRADLD